MTSIFDHRPEHMLMGFDVPQELAAEIRERLPNLPPDNWLGEQVEQRQINPETPAQRAIRLLGDEVRAALGIKE